jgi:hypothetical protein
MTHGGALATSRPAIEVAKSPVFLVLIFLIFNFFNCLILFLMGHKTHVSFLMVLT